MPKLNLKNWELNGAWNQFKCKDLVLKKSGTQRSEKSIPIPRTSKKNQELIEE